MDVHLSTLGCRLNEAELESWSDQLIEAGHRVVDSADGAHVVVLNTCAVTSIAGRKSRQLLRRLRRANPDARLVVTGCYSELSGAEIAAEPGVEWVVANVDKDNLGTALAARFGGEHASAPPPELPDPIEVGRRNRAFIKVQDGCRNRCAFCIITVARGAERSKTIADVTAEVQRRVTAGAQEVVLTGVHIGGYGSDHGSNLRELVEAVLADTDVKRLRIGSLEPWDIPEGFWSLWENPRLCNHLHLPLQSGSDTVLRRMSRRCSTSEFRQLAELARDQIPALNLTTDVIVGFPGESDAEWRQTMDFVEAVGFGHVHIFSYSPREGTRAAAMADQVPAATKKARSRELHALGAAMKRQTLKRNVGSLRRVLWEGRGEPTDGGLRWSGYTENYLSTVVVTPPDANLNNAVSDTRIEAVDGEALVGTLEPSGA